MKFKLKILNKISLVLFLLLLVNLTYPSNQIKFNFSKKSVNIIFNNLNIKNISKNYSQKQLIIFLSKNLNNEFKTIDYKIIKTLKIKKNIISINLNKLTNFSYKKNLLTFYYIPKKGLIKKNIVELYKSPSKNSKLVTEAVLGNECKILKSKNNFFKVAIKEQSNYKGWLKKQDIDLFFNVSEKNSFKNITQKKWTILHNKNKKLKLSAGTSYKILKTQKNKIYIKLKNGTTGWIKNNLKSDKLTIRSKIIKTAKNFLGVPYKWGGTSSTGMDCSGFIYTVFNINDIKLPRDAKPQFKKTRKISKHNLKKGDLVFFQTYKVGPSNVGIYIGNNKFIHASSKKGITISNLSQNYFKKRYFGATRIIDSFVK